MTPNFGNNTKYSFFSVLVLDRKLNTSTGCLRKATNNVDIQIKCYEVQGYMLLD